MLTVVKISQFGRTAIVFFHTGFSDGKANKWQMDHTYSSNEPVIDRSFAMQNDEGDIAQGWATRFLNLYNSPSKVKTCWKSKNLFLTFFI